MKYGPSTCYYLGHVTLDQLLGLSEHDAYNPSALLGLSQGPNSQTTTSPTKKGEAEEGYWIPATTGAGEMYSLDGVHWEPLSSPSDRQEARPDPVGREEQPDPVLQAPRRASPLRGKKIPGKVRHQRKVLCICKQRWIGRYGLCPTCRDKDRMRRLKGRPLL